MAKNTNRRKANRLDLPITALSPRKYIEKLPFDEKVLERTIAFSVVLPDRKHELFNLGGLADDNTVGGKWFLDLLDYFKSVNGKTIQELKCRPYCLHPVDWSSANGRVYKLFQPKKHTVKIDKTHKNTIKSVIASCYPPIIF